MGVELYTQQSVFNLGLTSMRPVVQLCDPIYDQDLVTKKFLEEKLSMLSELPVQIPNATTSVLGGVKQGSGVYISPDGALSILDYERTKILQEWLLLNGSSTTQSNSWVVSNSANITPLNAFNQATMQITGASAAVQDYDNLYKISKTLVHHASSVDSFVQPTTWVHNNSSHLTTTRETSTVSIGINNISINGLNNIIVGYQNKTNNFNNLVILGHNADPTGSDRVVLGSVTNPLSCTTTAGSPVPVGFILVEINGRSSKIPYYDV